MRSSSPGRSASRPVSASLFGIVLGLAGLGNAWRMANKVWGLPSAVAEGLELIAVAIWAILLCLYASNWMLHRKAVVSELRHPVQRSYIGLIGVATLLSALALAPYSLIAGKLLFLVGGLFSLFYGIWQTGSIWKDTRHHDTATAALYLPTVAGSFVTATTAAALGYDDWGRMAFGAGLFSWLAIESVLAHRLYSTDELPVTQRASLGIQFAPPVVGGVAYMSLATGSTDLIASALLGYGLLQLLIVVRLIPWILHHRFGSSYWAFTFGSASLANMLLRMLDHGGTGAIALLAPAAFVWANLVVAAVTIGTLHSWLAPAPRTKIDVPAE